MNLYQFTSKLPLQKIDKFYKNYITPKISLKINPSDMKNYSNDSYINVDNVFNFNRLGINDPFERNH